MKISIKKGDKVVDRWYSFNPNSFGITGVGKVLKVSYTKKRVFILFENKQVVEYDFAHILEFVIKNKRGMAKKYHNKIVPK